MDNNAMRADSSRSICLSKVGVSMDDGTVVRFASTGYLMNHYGLDVERTALAIIPSDGGEELLCHEFLCADPDGARLLVYCDAETGLQRRLLILLKSDNGVLTY